MVSSEIKLVAVVAGLSIVLANLATALQITALWMANDVEAKKQSVEINNALLEIKSRE